MKWMIIRQEDERSSDICQEIEKRATLEGGLEFPFTINGRTYTRQVLNDALRTTGQYYTNLFHEHCRSHLVPLSSESSIMHPDRQIDDIDKRLMVGSALAYNADLQLEQEVDSGETDIGNPDLMMYRRNKYNLQTKQSLILHGE